MLHSSVRLHCLYLFLCCLVTWSMYCFWVSSLVQALKSLMSATPCSAQSLTQVILLTMPTASLNDSVSGQNETGTDRKLSSRSRMSKYVCEMYRFEMLLGSVAIKWKQRSAVIFSTVISGDTEKRASVASSGLRYHECLTFSPAFFSGLSSNAVSLPVRWMSFIAASAADRLVNHDWM